MAFLQGRGQVPMTKPAPNWKLNRLSLAASGLSLGLQLCSWIAMWEQQSFHGTCLIGKSLNRWPATPSKPVSVVDRTDSPSVQLTGEAAIQFSIATKKNVPTGVILEQIFNFKSLLEASSLEGYFSFDYQTWNDGMTDVHRPPTLTLRSRTGAAKPTLWRTSNPCHFTVPCFIFKTKTFSFSSKQALSNNVFVVKIGRTTTLRRLFKVINFRLSKFVCPGLWYVRGRSGDALDNAGLPRCTHPDNNSASRLLRNSIQSFSSWLRTAVMAHSALCASPKCKGAPCQS